MPGPWKTQFDRHPYPCLSTDRPDGSLYWDGFEIIETDTRQIYNWNTSTGVYEPASAARGVRARLFYNGGDQSLPVASGIVALAGSPLLATITAGRFTSLHTNISYYAVSLAALRLTHYWNGTAVWVDAISCDHGINTVSHFSTPPLGLAAVTGNYAVTIQAFSNDIVITPASFTATYMWVEDMGKP